MFQTEEEWAGAVARSSVRLQWDPDHDPCGGKQARRAIQLGLAGEAVRQFASDWIVSIEDISEFVAEQRTNAGAKGFKNLLTPREDIYKISDTEVAMRLGVSQT